MKKLSTKGEAWFNRLGAWIFPPACLFCHQPVVRGLSCCEACVQDITIWPHHACRRCGVLLPQSMVPGPCGHCLNSAPAQSETHSLYQYHGVVRDALLSWKLQGHDAAVRWLLHTARPRLSELIAPHDLLLPVPMPLSRMRQRGQHHAADMCRWLADDLGCNWDWQLLRRIGEQERQSALTGSARRKNLRKAFVLAADYAERRQAISPPPAVVWVIDDILTTGSTLHYAARASLRLACTVKVLSLARTSLKG